MRVSRALPASTCLFFVLAAQQDWPVTLRETFRQGVSAQKEGRLDEAERAFLKVLAMGGKASFVYNNLGIVYQQRGGHARAIEQFREALRIESGYAQPRALLGASLLATGRLDEALPQLEQAVNQLPREPLVRLTLAQMYVKQGKFEDARREVDRELSVMPGSVMALELRKQLTPEQPAAPE